MRCAAVVLLAGMVVGVSPRVATASRAERGQVRDTVLDVRPGDRLVAKNLEGRILVEGWDRDEVQVEIGGSGRTTVELRREDRRVEVQGSPTGGRRGPRSYRIRVPRWMQVEVGGIDVSIEAEGVGGDLAARTVEGDIHVKDARGSVSARSVDGVVEVEDVVGDVVASSGDDDVVLRNIRGALRVQSVDGSIRLQNVDAPRVEAETVDGDVEFDGVLQAGGHYRLVTHDGDVVVRVPERPDVSVFVSTHEGEFRSDFTITVNRLRGGREFRFTLGRGGADLHLEAFDGDIRLSRR